MSRYRRPVTAEQKAKAEADRDRKLRDLHEKLEQQVRMIRTGDDWQRWLSFAARLHHYSFQNTLLILAQRPDASVVAGYEAWRRMDRQVDKGEKGIAILAPIVRRPKPGEDAPEAPAEKEDPERPRVVGFRPAYVWDVAQTSGARLPEQPAPALLRGEAPDGLWDALAALVEQAGYRLERGDCGRANGVTNPMAKVVRVRADLDDAQAVKTLAHELGHVQLHCAEPAAELSCRGTVEVEAESVAYLVTAAHGLDSGSYTFPYVTHWASSVSGATPEETVRRTGERVLRAARWILDGTLTPAVDDSAVAQLAERAQAGSLVTAALRGRSEAGRVRAQVVSPRRADPSAPREVPLSELLQLQAAALDFFGMQVAGSWVPEHLTARGLEAALTHPWSAGWAPAAWTGLVDHLRELGADDSALLGSGLASRARTGSLVDRFRDRLMIPLRRPGGDVVGFIGRAQPSADLARTPKYLNSPQTPLYTKGDLLFGLQETAVRLQRGAMPVLVEGPLDAIAVTVGSGGRCAGLAPCGTSLTAVHVQRLADTVDLPSRGVVIATDADAAGQGAAAAALNLLTPYGISPQRAGLPPGMDPADVFARGGGAELTAVLLDRSRPLADAVIQTRLEGWNTPFRWVEERIAALQDVAPLVASLPIVDVRRQVDRLSQQLGLDITTVQREIAAHIGVPRGRPPARSTPRAARDPGATRPAVPTPGGPRRSHR